MVFKKTNEVFHEKSIHLDLLFVLQYLFYHFFYRLKKIIRKGQMKISGMVKYCFDIALSYVCVSSKNFDNSCRIEKYDNDTKIKMYDVFETFKLVNLMINNAVKNDDCFDYVKIMLLLEKSDIIRSIDETKSTDYEHYRIFIHENKNKKKIKKHLQDIQKYISTNLNEMFEPKKDSSKNLKAEIRIAFENLFWDIIDLEMDPVVYEYGKKLCPKVNVEKTFIAKNRKTKVYHIFNYHKISLNFILEVLKSCIIHDLQIDGTEL